jgi:Protein of unknown function (DUF4058)
VGDKFVPLHNWTKLTGWEGVHIFWMTELARWLKSRLPPEYKAFIGASPMLGIDVGTFKPDVGVQSLSTPILGPSANGSHSALASIETEKPDLEAAVATLQEDTSVMVEQSGRLVSVIELISPRNKDRPESRIHFCNRYLSYMKNGVHMLMVDVFARPADFSFAQTIAAEFGIEPPPFVAPLAVSYRVGEPAAAGGRMLGVWQRRLVVDHPLPQMPLPLLGKQLLFVDLEATYNRATGDAYLS